METPNSLEFFVICTPGLEESTRRELHAWFPSLKPRLEKGGISFTASMAEGLAANLALKTATRVLVRMAEFGCRDFPKLFRKISGFSWEDWVADDALIEFHASCHGSRLKMKKRIEETCHEARVARLKKLGRPHGRISGKQQVFVRVVDDVCTLSLDTSGEILHKRGARVLSSDAPLRESTAASLLWLLDDGASDVELVDPMTGAGTFLIEAAGLFRPVRSRAFAFQTFRGEKAIAREPKALSDRYSRLIGFDIDPRAIIAAKENLSRVEGAPKCEIINADFFTAEPLPAAQGPRRVIANPPYNERIAIKGRIEEFFGLLFSSSERIARPDSAAFIVPEKAAIDRISVPKEWRLISETKFSNGGLPVTALCFMRRT